jgi:hypothetical protein
MKSKRNFLWNLLVFEEGLDGHSDEKVASPKKSDPRPPYRIKFSRRCYDDSLVKLLLFFDS